MNQEAVADSCMWIVQMKPVCTTASNYSWSHVTPALDHEACNKTRALQ